MSTNMGDSPPPPVKAQDAPQPVADVDVPTPVLPPLMNWQGQAVLILGLGVSGLSMARWCAQHGARVVVADSRPQPPQLDAVQQAWSPDWAPVRFVCAAFDADLLRQTQARAVFKSPGLAPAEVQDLWRAAQAQGLVCGTELSLFWRALQDLRHVPQSPSPEPVVTAEQALPTSGVSYAPYAPQVLAITGTNGKTTVTRLTGCLLERAGWRVAVAGNIGPSLLDTLGQALKTPATLPQVWVLELSSFQLDGVEGFVPTAATVLNLSQDHLDWHSDMAVYAAAKRRIWGPADSACRRVLPREGLSDIGAESWAQGRPQDMSFGADVPTRVGDWGIERVNGMDWLVRAIDAHAHESPEQIAQALMQEAAASASKPSKRRRGNSAPVAMVMQHLMPVQALRIRGRHNALNALAALALACSTGASLASMLYGLRDYAGEPHRMQSLAVVQGVEFFDDSKGTNVGATLAAIQGLGAEQRLVPILGGDGKGQDFSPLAAPLAQCARAVVLIGRDARLIEQALAERLQAAGVPMVHARDLPQAVQRAAECSQAGDAVLLSPACASWDMFRNYVHRAEVFAEAVAQWALAHGEIGA